jgi:TetR/AcrR family transcriptional regulator, transcriptional repressor for nem operon
MVGMRQFDEQRVLARSLDVFWQKGLRTTSMLDLAQATGVQRGSLYNAYGGKERLFLLAFDQYAARFLKSAAEGLAHPDPRHGLLAFFDAAVANMASGSPPRGCLTTKMAVELSSSGRCVRERVRALLDGMEAILAKALSSEAARERLALDPGLAAQVIVTFTRGLAVMERAYGDRKRLVQAARGLVEVLMPAKATGSMTRIQHRRNRQTRRAAGPA